MAQQLEQRQGEEPKDASELTPESEAGQEDLGYSALPSDAYEEEEWETQKQKVWPHQIHVFGMRQNQINRRYSAWIRTLEIQNRALEIRVQRLEEELAEQKKELERQKEKEVESLGRMVLDIENMKREFRKFYQLAESLTGMQNDLNQFRKVASDVRQMKTAMSQLQVSAKLNGNAVARILQQMQRKKQHQNHRPPQKASFRQPSAVQAVFSS